MSNIETTFDRGMNYAAKQARIKRDEEELAEMMKQYNAARNGEVQEEDIVEEEEAEELEVEAEEVEVSEDDADVSSDEAEEEDEEEVKDPWEKRYGDLRRHAAKKEAELKKKIAALEGKVEQGEIPTIDENIEQWRSKYPDIAAIVERIAEKKAAEKFEGFADMKRDATREKAESIIMKAHPDFDKLREDGSDLHAWAAEQPSWISNALYENEDDGMAVVRVLDLYKSDRGLTEKKATKKKANVDAVKSVSKKAGSKVKADSGEGTIRESDVNKMSDQEFEDNYDRIQKAMKEGKFVYDMSTPARQNFR